MKSAIALWSVLVWASALPLLAVTWPLFTAAERIAEVCGVIVWNLVMVLIERRLQGRRLDLRALHVGALAVAGLHVVALITEPSLALALLYSPAIRLSAPLIRAFERIAGDRQDVPSVLTLTLLCGAQALALAYGLGHLVERIRSGMARPLRSVSG